MGMPCPGCIHISTQYRQSLSLQNNCATPAGCCIIWHFISKLQSKPLETLHMLYTTAFIRRSSCMAIFVLQLNANNRTSILAHFTFNLLCKPCPELLYILHIQGIICSCLMFPGCSLYIAQTIMSKLCYQPVRETAVSRLTMCPGSDTQPYRHIQLLTKLQKRPDIPASAKIPFSLVFFMVIPEYISSQNIYPACLHFQNRFFPLRRHPSGEMKFSHNRQHRSAILR